MLRGSSEEAGASSSVVAFLVAGVLFMASVVAVLVTTRQSTSGVGADDASDAAAFGVQAGSLADLLLKSPGFTGSEAGFDDWVKDVDPESRTGKSWRADHVARLGLLDADDPTKLDYAKFQNLRNSPFQEDATATPVDCDGDGVVDDGDCFVNYVEARNALGLDKAGLDFHIRAYPALQSVAEILACSAAIRDDCRDQNLQVTYIGDIVPGGQEVIVEEDKPTQEEWLELFGDPSVTCTAEPTGLEQVYRLSTTLTNNGAGTAGDGLDLVQLRVSFTADFAAGPAMTQNANGPLLDQGDSATFSIHAPAYNSRLCEAGSTIRVDVKDPLGVLFSFTTTLGSTVSGASAADKDLWLESHDYFVAGDPIDVSYYGNNIKNEAAVLEILSGDRTTYADLVTNRATYLVPGYSTAIAKMKQNGDTLSFPALPAGTYTAVLVDGTNAASTTALRVTERIVVVASAPTGTFAVPAAATETSVYSAALGDASDEVAMLEILIEKFCPTYWDVKDMTAIGATNAHPSGYYQTTPALPLHDWVETDWDARCGFKTVPPWVASPGLPTQYGDVFPANDKVLRDGLICRLTSNCEKSGDPIYDYVDVLIVGSGVEHGEMSSQNIKGPIETWVEGGGTVIVLGSEVGKNNNWLSPFLNSGTRSSGGGVSVPDPAHPVLHVPDELDYSNYDNDGDVWDFHGSHDANERFTQVVSQAEDGDFEPILAVSKPGALRDDEAGTSGTVILTTWVAYDVYRGATSDEAAFAEGLKFFNNLLMMGYGDLYLDYGPDIPDNTNVVPSVRVARIQHPDFADPIDISLNVFVFG